ncbi:MAG: GNAT family N-acetyltransferase [Rhodospirillales bacterium]|nr:GNAT family N-acetyltransferase [Rhodospirillales bacterium]
MNNNFIFGGYTSSGDLAGVIGFYVPTSNKQKHKATLWGMFVRPEVRGVGLSKYLAEEVIKQAENLAEEILLTVVDSNIAALRLYKGLGFKKYGLEKRALKIGNEYQDELLMSLLLK